MAETRHDAKAADAKSDKAADDKATTGRVTELKETKADQHAADRTQPGAATVVEGPADTQRDEFTKARESHVGAEQAAMDAAKVQVEADEALAKAVREAGPGAVANVPVDQEVNEHGQVRQEGAKVRTPPQPPTPPFHPSAAEHMDITPPGFIRGSGSDDYDQTVHPKSRVDDPTKPL